MERDYLEQENFIGNDRHLKILAKAIAAGDMEVWNRFCHSMGPGFSPDLRGIDLSGASLKGANFRRARLQNADLSQADLTQAIFFGAKLTGASLKNATLKGAKIKVKLKAHTSTPSKIPEDVLKDPMKKKFFKLRQIENAAKALLEEKKLAERKKDLEKRRSLQRRKSGFFRIEENE
jgi:hypothetical protein